MKGMYRVEVLMPEAEFEVHFSDTDDRIIVIGPLPGSMMFTSFEAPTRPGSTYSIDWAEVQSKIQSRWTTMSAKRRDKWYGPKGTYTTTEYPLMLPGYQGEWDR